MNLRDKFELGKHFTMQGVGAAIPENGYVKINSFLSGRFGIELPQTFDMQWVSNKGEYSGTFPKRVSQYLHKVHKTELSDSDKETIGNYVRQYSFKRDEFEYEFTNNLNWRSGDFGDSGSCFWSGKTGARLVMISCGFLAVRFYEKGKKFGRAWILFPPKWPDNIFVINAYPKSFGLDQVALVLSKHLDMDYKPVALLNHDTWEGTFHINQGRGIVLFDKDKPIKDDELDLKLPTEIACMVCKRQLDMGYALITEEGEVVCRPCYETKYYKCDMCAKVFRGKAKKVLGYAMCVQCIEENVVKCPKCNKDALRKRIVKTELGEMCPECWEKIWFSCIECGKATRHEDGRDRICPKCIAKYYSDCSECGKLDRKERMHKNVEGVYVCSTCRRKNYVMCMKCGKARRKGTACPCNPKGENDLKPTPFKLDLGDWKYTIGTSTSLNWKITIDDNGEWKVE